ncbi:hypothetical protein M9Y10_034013 [Tritrichomonas musculus]|uniref:Uncharacterized protein n=1 Tax=Tritrichomonas musculus TaxID=1915356 RepID=A0ABR2KDS7_9EUKA
MSNYLSEDPQFLLQFDSDIDSQGNYFQMQQEIDRLKEENNSIRNQFNEATSMGDQLEKVHQKNIQLTKQLRIANSERDDLQKRLDISLQRNEELKRILEQEKPAKKIIINNREENKTLLEKERFQWQNEKNNFQLKIAELQQLLKNEQNKTAEIQNSINNLLDSSNRFFNRTFSSVSDIQNYFAQNPYQQFKVPTPRKSTDETDAIIDNLNQKIKKQRSDLKELKKLYTASEARASKLQSDTIKSREEAESIISGLETKITEVQHNYQLQEIQYQHEMQSKDSQIKNLQDVIEKLMKKQNETITDTINVSAKDDTSGEVSLLKKQIAQYKDKLHDYSKTISQLKHDNSQINSQLSEVSAANEHFKKKYSTSENQIGSILDENDKLKNSISTIQIECDKLHEQYETSISQIQNLESTIKQNETNLIEAKNTNEKLKNSLNILDTVVEKQKNELHTLYDERDKIITILQKENSLLKNYEIHFQKISEENRYIKKNYHEEQIKVTNQIYTQNDIDIPYASWFCKEFPSELCTVITDTAKNENLPITAKLKYILSLIAKYYNKIIKDYESKFEASVKEADEKAKLYQQVFDSVLIVANKAIDSFSSCQVGLSDIPNILENIRNRLEAKEEEVIQLNDKLLSIYSKLGSNENEEALNIIDNLYETAHQMKQQLEHSKLKIIQKKKEYKIFKSKCVSKQQEIEDLVNDQQAQYEFVLNEKENLLDKLKKLEEMNESLKNNITEIKTQHKEALDQHEKRCDEEITILKNHIDNIQNQYSQELNTKEKLISDMKQKIQQTDKELIQWKRTAELLKKSKVEKDNQILEITTKIQDAERARQKKAASEKASLKAQYEQLMSHAKEKNEDLRKLVLKSSRALEELQAKNKELMASCTQLSIEKQQNLAKIDCLKEEFEREHRLMDTKLRASALSNELQTQNAIEQIKSQNDYEKRNIFGFIATTFRQFFNASEILSENSFKPLIEKVQSELLRLYKQEASLRKMLGITKNESIEDHISKLLLDYYHSS